MAAAESSTLQPLASISVNQDKIEAVKKIVEITEKQEKQTVKMTEEIENVQEESPQVNTEVEPEVQLKQAIEELSDDDYAYEEEPEAKDYSSEYMVNDAIEYPTLIDEEPEEVDETSEGGTTEETEDEVAGALNMT